MPVSRSGLLRDAVLNARAHAATTVVLALIAAAMTAATLLTAGRAAAAEAEVMRNLDEAGPRLVTITVADTSPGIAAATLDLLGAIRGVEWVLGLGPARDIRSGATGARVNVAARDLINPLPGLVTVELGRVPREGEAIIGAQTQRKLQLIEPSGTVDDDSRFRPVVGRFTSSGAIADLERLVLIRPEEPATHATLVYLLATDAGLVEGIVAQVRAISGVFPDDALQVATSPDLIELNQVLSGQVGALSRQLALGAVAAGVLLVALTMTLALNTRRRDFGRRRALGSTRSALIAVTLLEAAIPVIAGVAAGTALGLAAVAWWMGNLPPPGFVAASALLTTLSGLVAAVPPAAFAAWQDPVRILRVP